MLQLRNQFPGFLQRKLWGDRARWGNAPNEKDPEWIEWEKVQAEFYKTTQRKGLGATVNDSGYSIMSEIDLGGKCVLEIGPGNIRHHHFWNSVPDKYYIADINQEMMEAATEILTGISTNFESFLIQRNEKLPIPKNSVDVIVTFYSLEHLHPLEDYLEDMKYYLKPDGVVVGAVPTEGGLLWGVGRYLTSRRWLHKNTKINYDKLICWEHPNFCDQIIRQLDNNFQRLILKSWPLNILPLLDANLTFSFCYKNNNV